MLGEPPPDRNLQLFATRAAGRGVAVLDHLAPLVEPRLADPQHPAAERVRHPVIIPLGSDESGHGYRPIASLTQRATERLSTSRSIASSAFSRRNLASSARSSSLNRPSPP